MIFGHLELLLASQATPSERLVLKIAASLLKQLDQDYEIDQDADRRIKLGPDEMDWLPDTFEVWNSIVRPKNWEIPERMEAVRREGEEIQKIMDESGLDHWAAVNEYLRRREKKS